MPNFDDLKQQLDELAASHRLRQLVPRQIEGGELIDADGKRLHNFGGNDYLGLAAERTSSGSSGSGASALVCGWTTEHQRLVDNLARFESTEAALLFPTGYAACSGTVATLARRGDLILSDQLNHASLIDGCRLSRADRIVYPHRDCAFVEEVLRQQRRRFHHVWIVTDGVFSMDGHIAPLAALADLAQQHDATLLVDEAHATGVLGETGSGVCEALGVKDRVPIRIGTLSKAIGGQGGFVAGPRVVVDYLINRCRSLIYSTSLSPVNVATAISGLDAILASDQRRGRVQSYSRQVRDALSIDAQPLESSVPIVPWILGEDARAMEASACLAESGFYVPAIRPPTVPPGTARLRISLSAAHQAQTVTALCEAITRFAAKNPCPGRTDFDSQAPAKG